MKAFGTDPVSESIEKTSTPTGELCQFCDKPITSEDSGFTLPYYFLDANEPKTKEVSYHRTCFVEGMLGLK